MIEKVLGPVRYYKSLGRGVAQLEVTGCPHIIELYTSDAWVLNDGDVVRIAGEKAQGGKFLGYAYFNQTRNVWGNASCDRTTSIVFIVASVVFFWGIFPLFLHLPAGIRGLKFCRKVRQAVRLVHQ